MFLTSRGLYTFKYLPARHVHTVASLSDTFAAVLKNVFRMACSESSCFKQGMLRVHAH